MKKTNLDHWIETTESIPQLTRENLESLQLDRLNQVLSRCRQKDLPKSLSCLEELQTLPFTTAEMLAQSPGAYLLTSQSQVSRVISGATSGTTGPAKRVFYSQQDLENTIGFFSAGIGQMLTPGQSCLIAFPFSGAFGLGDLIARAVERLGAIPICAGFGQSWQDMHRLIVDTQPTGYIGFPVPLLSLLRLYDDIPIRQALVSADACPAGVMAQLEARLSGPLYPHYGSRECGLGGAVTCPAFQGMHLRENHIIPEIIDPNGQVLPEGAYGELVITTIGLEAMPLIRYRTGDFTRILPPCPCGGITKRIDTVSRREGPISIEALDSRLFTLEGLVDYQAAFTGTLEIQAKITHICRDQDIYELAKSLYPQIPISVRTSFSSPGDRPLYLGKRHILTKNVPIL